jgi:hypothetical protein
MSENPNPTRCGNCGTDNPPGAEYCEHCGQPLTLTADAVVLEEFPEVVDEPGVTDGDDSAQSAGVPVLGGLGGAPLTIPPDQLRPND